MGKGKVHPSPAPAPAAGGGVVGGETAEGVLLRLLPVAVLAMAAPLGAEGKEVLAYLVLASLRSSAPPTPAREESSAAEECGSGRKAHRPELGCGCFGCYTAYWSRWDGSPERDREAIHRAIEAFDEHLARKEEGKGSRRRKKRAAAKDKAEKGKAPVAVEPPLLPPPPPAVHPEQEEAAAAKASVLPEAVDSGEEAAKTAKEEEAATTATTDAGDGVQEERRRRVWGALAGVFDWRGWGLWGSH